MPLQRRRRSRVLWFTLPRCLDDRARRRRRALQRYAELQSLGKRERQLKRRLRSWLQLLRGEPTQPRRRSRA